MQTRRIAGLGGYLPLLRLERRAAVSALKWSGLGGPRDGHRSVATWDEDALTIAVEAARMAVNCADQPAIDEVIFASTSAPFNERAHAPLVVDALALDRQSRSNDVSGSRRCAVAALVSAMRGGEGATLITAGEHRVTKPGNPLQLAYGDGGAAVVVSDLGPVGLIASASQAHDFIDIYASREHPTPYQTEERFIRDVAVPEVFAPTILAACKRAGIAPSDIKLAVVPEPVSGVYKALASAIGLRAPNATEQLTKVAGDLGAAHALFALALALDGAKPGDIVLLVGFGSGCDALLLDVSGPVPGASEVAAMLKSGVAFSDYVRFLNLSGSLNLDWGMRAEFEQKAQATVLERYGRDVMGFVGGRDSQGNVQFPKTRIPVNPAASAPETLASVRLADLPAKIVSITADRLNFTPDPPFYFGLVQFDNGARVLMEFTDAGPAGLNVGDEMRMRFRIKSLDRRRGFRTYFWKAAPMSRSPLEA